MQYGRGLENSDSEEQVSKQSRYQVERPKILRSAKHVNLATRKVVQIYQGSHNLKKRDERPPLLALVAQRC